MTHETKERVTFMAASLFDLAEMTESDLPSVVEVVGIDAIRDLMEMDHLRYECSYDRMAEEICNYIDWDPMLVMTGWTDEDTNSGRSIHRIRGRQARQRRRKPAAPTASRNGFLPPFFFT